MLKIWVSYGCVYDIYWFLRCEDLWCGIVVKNALYVSVYFVFWGARSGVVVKALRYKPAGRGFVSRWCHWNFSLTLSFRSHYGHGVDSASNRNEYQVYFLWLKAAGA